MSSASIWAPQAMNGFIIQMQRDMRVSSFRLELYNSVTLNDDISDAPLEPYIAATEYRFNLGGASIRATGPHLPVDEPRLTIKRAKLFPTTL